MGTGLPGAKAPASPKKSSKSGKPKGGPEDGEDEAKIEELSFEEIKALEEEFIQLTQGKVRKELDDIKKKREEDELLGRERKVEEQVSLADIETAFESKKGGLPPHLAALPAEHPLRARFEQGFRRRPDGTWFKAVSDPEAKGRKRGAKKSSALVFWIIVVLILLGMLAGLRSYNKALELKRSEIIALIKKKGLDLENPKIRQRYNLILVTNWIPDLERLLREIQRMPRNFDVFPDNVETGSYLEYIERHNLPFDEMDAQEWFTRSIRKPAPATQ